MVDGSPHASIPSMALFEVDVTAPRQALRAQKARTGATLSFTAFVIACLAKAIDENKALHAYRDWRNRLILFDTVDVNTMVEVALDGRNVVLPVCIRAANQRTINDMHAEIRAVQANPLQARAIGVRWFARLPRFARDLFYWAIFKKSTVVEAELWHSGRDLAWDVWARQRLGDPVRCAYA